MRRGLVLAAEHVLAEQQLVQHHRARVAGRSARVASAPANSSGALYGELADEAVDLRVRSRASPPRMRATPKSSSRARPSSSSRMFEGETSRCTMLHRRAVRDASWLWAWCSASSTSITTWIRISIGALRASAAAGSAPTAPGDSRARTRAPSRSAPSCSPNSITSTMPGMAQLRQDLRLAHEHADEALRRSACSGRTSLITTGLTKPTAPSARARYTTPMPPLASSRTMR